MTAYSYSWLQLEERLGGSRPVLGGTAEEMRSAFDGLLALIAPQCPPISEQVTVQDGGADGIAHRIYTPSNNNRDRTGQPLPVGVYYHGGGLALGSLDSEDRLCRALAETAGVILVSIDYRLSPEHKAPAHVDDALKGFEWAYQNAADLGGDPAKVFTIGVSAGAGLALSVVRKIVLRQTSIVPAKGIRGVVALAPVVLHPDNIPVAYQAQYKAYTENAENVPIVDKNAMLQFFSFANLQPDNEDYFVGLDAKSLKRFPPTYVVTCAMDPLRDDGVVLEQALKAAGIPVKGQCYQGLPHCFWIFPKLPETEQFRKDTVEGIKWVLSK